MQYADKDNYPTIYSLMEYDVGFRKLFYPYIFGIMLGRTVLIRSLLVFVLRLQTLIYHQPMRTLRIVSKW